MYSAADVNSQRSSVKHSLQPEENCADLSEATEENKDRPLVLQSNTAGLEFIRRKEDSLEEQLITFLSLLKCHKAGTKILPEKKRMNLKSFYEALLRYTSSCFHFVSR